MKWTGDEGTGDTGHVIPDWAFDEMRRRYVARGGSLEDGAILTAELAEELYPREEFLKDQAARQAIVPGDPTLPGATG